MPPPGFTAAFLLLVLLRLPAWVRGFSCAADPSPVPSARRVVSTGDVHGDWKHATERLTALGLLRDGAWAGNDTILVQTGDVVDRGHDGKAVWELLFTLQEQAPAHGGEVILLVGNHELMVMLNDLRYVTEIDKAIYGGADAFQHEWSPRGDLGRRVRERCQAIAIVSDVVYVHAGLLPHILRLHAGGSTGADAATKFNEAARALFQGDSRDIRRSRSPLLFDEGPFWTRTLALGDESVVCPLLAETFRVLKVRRMVVGHTPHEKGEITSRCGGRLVLGDTLMSQAYTGSAKVSANNEAAFEFFGDSSGAMAVYPVLHGGSCQPLPLDAEFAGILEL